MPLGALVSRTCYFSGLCYSNIPQYFLDFALNIPVRKVDSEISVMNEQTFELLKNMNPFI